MKNFITLCLSLVMLTFGFTADAQTTISKADRAKASASLKASNKTLLKAVKGLSDTQLNYKASPDSWSVAECVEHLAISENMIFGLVGKALEGEADPSLRASLPFSDDQVVGFITDRSTKVKTQAPFEPKNGYGTYTGSLEAYKSKRKENMKYVKKTDADLRNHYFDFPFGKVDAYQVILFMSGHTVRHTKQIAEVMASAGFPAA